MANDKKSFLLYTDIYFTVKKLTDEQAGILFKHILSYVNDENPVINNVIIDLVFEPIKQSLKRDLRRYEKIIEKRSNAGRLGGLKSGEIRMKQMKQTKQTKQTKQMLQKQSKTPQTKKIQANEASEANEANALKTKQTKQTQANEAVIDSVSVSVSDSVSVIDSDKEQKEQEKYIIPPSIFLITKYCKERNNNVDPQMFFDHYEARGWIPKGYTKKMKDWKAAVRTWEKNVQNFKKSEKPRVDGYV